MIVIIKGFSVAFSKLMARFLSPLGLHENREERTEVWGVAGGGGGGGGGAHGFARDTPFVRYFWK